MVEEFFIFFFTFRMYKRENSKRQMLLSPLALFLTNYCFQRFDVIEFFESIFCRRVTVTLKMEEETKRTMTIRRGNNRWPSLQSECVSFSRANGKATSNRDNQEVYWHHISNSIYVLFRKLIMLNAQAIDCHSNDWLVDLKPKRISHVNLSMDCQSLWKMLLDMADIEPNVSNPL